MPFLKGYLAQYKPAHPKANSRGYVYEHRILAEKALGRQLPMGAQVHHVNGIKTDNSPGNLVICQDAAYHKLLHKRTEALQQSGNPNHGKCRYCGGYTNQEDIRTAITNSGRFLVEHITCARQYERRRIRPKRPYVPRGRPRAIRFAGVLNGRAKLTEQSIIEIRNSPESLRILALRFGMAKTTIADIKRRRLWKHIPDECQG